MRGRQLDRSTTIRVRTESGSDRIIESTWNVRSVPSAVADGLKTQLENFRDICPVARFAGLGFLGDMVPGLRTLRSLTRGYTMPPRRGSLSRTSKLILMTHHFSFPFSP